MKKIIGNILYGLVFVTLLIMIVSVISSRASGGEPQLFGYQFKTVLSGSMEPTFKTGSIIMVKEVDGKKTFKKGDVITFKQSDKSVVTHRINNVINQNGNMMYQTKGDNNKNPDTNPVLSQNIVAEYTGFTLPYVGYFLKYASSKIGTAILLILPGLLLLGYAAFTIRQAIKEIERKTAAQLPSEQKETTV